MEDELLWVQDKLPYAFARDWGSTLSSTQAMVKKHQVSMTQRQACFIPTAAIEISYWICVRPLLLGRVKDVHRSVFHETVTGVLIHPLFNRS